MINTVLDFIIFLIICSPIWAPFAYWGYDQWKNRIWLRGTFPEEVTFSKTNLMNAYIALTVCFITFDRNHQMRKIAYLKSFFYRQFKSVPDKYDEIVDRNFHYPIEPISIARWVNRYANEQQKKQLIQFLVGLCHIDPYLRKKEYDWLKAINRSLHLDLSFLEATIFSYRGNQQESRRTNGQKSAGATNPPPPVLSKRRKYAEILGVNENATVAEIKKRYRQLVKLYHPDKYARESKEQQEQAHQRFLEIQKAYEYLV